MYDSEHLIGIIELSLELILIKGVVIEVTSEKCFLSNYSLKLRRYVVNAE